MSGVLCRLVSCHVTSRGVASCHLRPRHVAMLCRVMLGHVASRHLCHVMSRHVMSRRVASRHVTSCHVASCRVMSCHVVSCRVQSCRVASCHVAKRGRDTLTELPHLHSHHSHSCARVVLSTSQAPDFVCPPTSSTIFYLSFRCGVIRSFFVLDVGCHHQRLLFSGNSRLGESSSCRVINVFSPLRLRGNYVYNSAQS